MLNGEEHVQRGDATIWKSSEKTKATYIYIYKAVERVGKSRGVNASLGTKGFPTFSADTSKQM